MTGRRSGSATSRITRTSAARSRLRVGRRPTATARGKQRGRQDRSADDRHVGQLAERAAGLDGSVDGRPAIERLGRPDLDDEQRRPCGDAGRCSLGRGVTLTIADSGRRVPSVPPCAPAPLRLRAAPPRSAPPRRGSRRRTASPPWPPPRRRRPPCAGPARRRTRAAVW